MLTLRGEQRFWTLICGMSVILTFQDFKHGSWAAGSFGVVIILMTGALSFAPKVRVVRPVPYSMPPADQVSAIVGNREIRFCNVGPIPHDVHVWHLYVEDGEVEYACMGHICHHPERHV